MVGIGVAMEQEEKDEDKRKRGRKDWLEEEREERRSHLVGIDEV